jgi:hypothetical protein
MFNASQEQDEKPEADASASSSSQDQGNWEARAKGFQRALAGKEGYLNKLQADFNDLKQRSDNEAITFQGEITQLKTQLEATSKKVAEYEAQLQRENAEIAALKRDQEVRKFMSKDYSDLTPWYDSGYLQVGALSGDELKAHLDGFRNLLGDKANTAVRETLRGATPPVSMPSGQSANMSTEDLAEWLMDPANDNNPERAKYQELYFSQLG